MTKILVAILVLLSVETSYGKDGKNRYQIKLLPTVCYASGESHRSFIAPQINLKDASLKKSNIIVDYVNFPADAQIAFQAAVDLWQDLIYSPMPIHVLATWTSLNKNVLGSCSPSDYLVNFNSTQIWDCYYPIALVEKMLGEEVNSSNGYEIDANFNKDFTNWYFGTDGNTPANKYDFESTVLHELAHGLGFSGYFYSSSGRGGYGFDGLPAVFDIKVQNKSGDRLTDKKVFSNPSTKLNLSFTSGWLDFYTPLLQGSLARLYAPSTWDGGSSIYHLDETTYLAGNSNSLMTPFSGMGEAVHDPGPNTLAIMNQIGWKTISIKHKQLKDVELVTSPFNFDVQILSDYDLDSTKIYLVYSSNKFQKADSVLLKATTVSEVFNAQLTKTQNGETQYYISASDATNRRFVFPSNAPSRYLSFTIGLDKVPPVLIDEPVKSILSTNTSLKIKVIATDNIGIKSVKLDYFINGGLINSIPLINDSIDLYKGNLVFPQGLLKDGDILSYRIVATDNSSQQNVSKLPLTGFYTVNVLGINKATDHYVNNFDSQTTDFINDGFNFGTVTGFDSQALSSEHPYLSPDSDNVEFNFTSILKYPIILKTDGKITFDEIVLVEPGDAGNNFGDPNFWDYVITEGSKDGGSTWKTLIDGYDSNAQLSWLKLFNSSMSGNNSTAVPTKDLFVKREFSLLGNGNFNVGDTILVRFRLFSDPYSNGWGWIIDNLAVQDFGTATNPVLLSSGEVEIYPNPATDHLNLQINSQNIINQIFLKVYNSSGKLVYTKNYPVGSNMFKTIIDTNNLIPGLYLFALEPEKSRIITRKILIQ